MAAQYELCPIPKRINHPKRGNRRILILQTLIRWVNQSQAEPYSTSTYDYRQAESLAEVLKLVSLWLDVFLWLTLFAPVE